MRASSLFLGASLLGLTLIGCGQAVDPDSGQAIDDRRVVDLEVPQAAAGPPEAADDPSSPSRPRTATSVPEERARQPLGHPGADGEADERAAALASIAPIDPGPDEEGEPVVKSPEGFQVVPGTAEAGEGPRVTYTVEVEPSVDVDVLAVAAVVEAALHHPRSWASEVTLQRVDDIDAAAIRVLLAEPVMMQQTKGTGGCETNGWPYPDLSPSRSDPASERDGPTRSVRTR